jgi:hypothetical protein
MDPRGGLDDVGKRKTLTLSGLELRRFGRPDSSQSLYRLRYPEIAALIARDTFTNPYQSTNTDRQTTQLNFTTNKTTHRHPNDVACDFTTKQKIQTFNV